MALALPDSVLKSFWKYAGKAIAAGFSFGIEMLGNISTAGMYGAFKALPASQAKGKQDRMTSHLDAYLAALKEGGASSALIALLKPLLAAAAGVIVIMEAAGIMAERTLFRPLRREFIPTMPPAGEVIEGWRRGVYDVAGRDARLKDMGYSDEDIAALVSISWATPQVQDIIRFAVREVYTPASRVKFRLDEGADEVARTAAPWLLKGAVPPEVLKDYWAAHWELPSAQQGYEMLHRGLINADELDMLLRAADVMPFWRDKLKGIAYAPLTRVDVRRMHKAGVISDDRLLKSYMDLGYKEEDARALAEWTKIYNQDPEASEQTWSDAQTKKARDLSASTLLDAYQDGLITSDFIKQTFAAFGYSAEEITLQLNIQDFKASQARTNAQVKAIKTAFLAGKISEKDARDLLGKFGLPDSFVQSRLEDFALERALKVDTPTKAEIVSWAKKGWLPRDRAAQMLLAMGYDAEWVELYLKV